MSCFPFTDKKRVERGERERSSTDVNYWGMLSGSPTEPVAMATHSGYGPLWEGVQRTAEKHHEKQQRVWVSAFCISGSILCTDAFLSCPWLSPVCSAVVECVQNAHTFQNGRHFLVLFSTLTPFHHSEHLSKPVFPKKTGVHWVFAPNMLYSTCVFSLTVFNLATIIWIY